MKPMIFFDVDGTLMDNHDYQVTPSTKKALQKLQENGYKIGIATGEIIEDYPEDYPNPSCLIFGYNVNGRILHIVAGCDNINIYIITAYYPDTKKFENDLKTRRKR